jgi:hypothetical protein
MPRSLAALVGYAMTALSSSLLASTATAPPDFERDIRPIFASHCVACHGSDKQESGLRLDTPSGIRRGGDGGRVLPTNRPNTDDGSSGKEPITRKALLQQSRLFRAVTGGDDELGKMPPKGPGLNATELALLESWMVSGARLPEPVAGQRDPSSHWSFQPPLRSPLPEVNDRDWVRNAIDYFVLRTLEANGIAPSVVADRNTLIRRLSLDLRGIPPTPREVDAFLADLQPNAYGRLVERMFASPAYGERWGRHWLDLARYADSNGYTRDFAREIWKYRDWVIAALNADMPFDQFTVEQFAGDLLPNATLDQRIATGFHRNTLINEEGGTDDEQFRVDAVADRVATTGVVYLGLTLGCARCHTHKYDPISQREYYQLFAFLNGCDEPKMDAPAPWQVEQGVVRRRDAIRAEVSSLEKQLAGQAEEFTIQQLAWEKTITPEFRATLPGPVQASLMLALAKRDDTQKNLVVALFKKSKEARAAFPLVDQIATLKASEPAIPTTMVLVRRKEPRITHVHRRGNFLDHGPQVTADVPAFLPALRGEPDSPGRLEFAKWLVDPENPLTPRVVVNRFWQRFFGRGIVDTENDFGTQGSPPTHPQLLDWLACEFVEQNWSIKSLQRLIVNSATYRQSSRVRSDVADSYNRLLARQSRLRLEAETIRDTALAAGGLLSHRIGGPSVHPPQPEGVFAFTQDPKPWKPEPGDGSYRRGMYTFFWRSSPYPALIVFDAPTGNVTCTRRVTSNTPMQALTLANDLQFVAAARALATKIQANGSADIDKAIEFAFKTCLSRRPSQFERQRLRQMFELQLASFEKDIEAARAFSGEADGADDVAVKATWTAIARVLMNLDEFITRE